MAMHPSTDQLVAYADGDAAGVDLVELARHVAECASCKETVTMLAAMRASLRQSAEERRLPPVRDGWPALSAKIAGRRRERTAVRWTAALMAASVVGMVMLPGVRARFRDRGATAGPAAHDASTLGAGPDETIATLSHAIAEGRALLPSTEQQAMDAVVHSIDAAIGRTQSALAADPTNSYLRAHLDELHRKRISALMDYVDLIRDHG
jgi:predicted anti-sigma-YlaC factor YlaD